MNIIKKSLNEIDVNDSFFDSLRNDYPNFNNWFLRKRNSNYFAYVTEDENGNLGSFLLLKEQIKLNPVKTIEEIPKNSHIYCLLKFSYPAPL